MTKYIIQPKKKKRWPMILVWEKEKSRNKN